MVLSRISEEILEKAREGVKSVPDVAEFDTWLAIAEVSGSEEDLAQCRKLAEKLLPKLYNRKDFVKALLRIAKISKSERDFERISEEAVKIPFWSQREKDKFLVSVVEDLVEAGGPLYAEKIVSFIKDFDLYHKALLTIVEGLVENKKFGDAMRLLGKIDKSWHADDWRAKARMLIANGLVKEGHLESAQRVGSEIRYSSFSAKFLVELGKAFIKKRDYEGLQEVIERLSDFSYYREEGVIGLLTLIKFIKEKE